ncbi:MAG: phosphoribosylanthranilate isomerase [Proteobacteria bacterium]|nr:phosphoribosylanthranilate isomerase [Pseudomonadota bacterium]
MSTQIKICGMTREDDALSAAYLGVNAIGLIFYDKSPRNVDVQDAKVIAKRMPPFVDVIGVFVNPTKEYVQEILSQVDLTGLQFHGEEPREFCESFKLPYIKTLRMKENTDIHAYIKEYSSMSALLLDTYQEDQYGGTGKTFSWDLIPKDLEKRLILAGGLTVSNVKEAIQKVKPYAVDVLSGVESSKGIKDQMKMKFFVDEVLRA